MREPMLILHFIGLAMGLGSGLSFLFLGAAAGKMEPAKRREFMMNAFPISLMGQYGLLLLVLTGGYLMTPYWRVLGDNPMLIAKLLLVVLLGALIGINSSYRRKAAQGNAEAYMPKIVMLGRVSLLTTLTIVVLAVLVFR